MSIQSLQLNPHDAARLHDAVLRGLAAAEGTSHSLVLTLGERAPALGFNGGASCVDVVGAAALPRRDGMLERLCSGLPGFGALARLALEACPGMAVAYVHVLQQSSAQACFNWHTDAAAEGYERVRKTLVVLLSNTHSSIQAEGEPERNYKGAGSAALFDSASVHRSAAATRGTVKIAITLKRNLKRVW
jgi:hypothetical protein